MGLFRAEDLEVLTPDKLGQIRCRLEDDFSVFCRWAFFIMRGVPFHWTGVHEAKARALQAVGLGFIKRLIINEPPRFSKTEMISVMWPLWSMIKNPRSNWFFISASDDLVQDTSRRIRNFLDSPEVAVLWPEIGVAKGDADSKLWKNTQGGVYRAAPIDGQITGFGAGVLGARIFSGALILDDLLKAQQARIGIARAEIVNGIYDSTIKNRVNDRNTPIVVGAQRLGDNDLPGFLLSGGSGEKWHHLRIPGRYIPEEEANARERYKRDWSFGIPLNSGLAEGFPWESKYGPKEDEAAQVSPDVWATQVLQNPRLTKGAFFQLSWFRRYQAAEIDSGLIGHVRRNDETIEIRSMHIFADTAQKTKQVNDFSVFQLWGVGMDANIYLLDQIRGKWEAPELQAITAQFLRKYENKAPRRYGWRDVHIEDKSSGTGLIQWLRRAWGPVCIHAVPRSVDKVSRAQDGALPLSAGRVYIPASADWLPDYLSEFGNFSKLMTHLHDDQIDPTLDAIQILLPQASGTILDRL